MGSTDTPVACFYCTSSPASICPHCGLLGICGEVHGAVHRPGVECLPFQVEFREGKGNVVVATRDIKPFQTIIVDRPSIVAPFDDTRIICVECYTDLEKIDTSYNCSKCQIPLCGPDCENGETHRPECQFLSASQPLISVVKGENNPVYAAIAPLRLLQVRKTNPDLWSLVTSLMDHLDQRRTEDKWNFVTEHVVPVITQQCKVDVESELIEKMIGIFRTNSVKWEKLVEKESRVRPVGHALCPVFSLLCHSCVNNTRYTQTSDGLMIVRAVRAISKGEEITTQYRGPNEGNIFRRPDFPSNWMFNCSCERCCDPTELGTMASTIMCQDCSEPTLLPSTLDFECVWQCTNCSREKSHETVLELVQSLDINLSSFKYSEPPEAWEELLKKFQQYLHPDHFLCMKVKRLLLQLYGSREGYRLNQMSREQLTRKVELCRNYVKVFSILEPGYRLWRGRLLDELVGPLSILLNLDLEQQKINKMEYILKYKEIIRMVKEAAKCRQFEERNENGTDDKIVGQYYQALMSPIQAASKD